jgi:hypothetical protein
MKTDLHFRQVVNLPLLAQTKLDMEQCFQFETQSIYDHGASVCGFASLIGMYCFDGSNPDHLRIPSWLTTHGTKLMDRIDNWPAFSEYMLYHDCGKPYCRTVDAEGKQHFPEHEKVSYQRWLEIDGEGYVAQCILHDMDIHRIKGDEVAAFAALPQAPSLLIAGLAEIHANAEMFGGTDNNGFKIKFAQIERRGKTACNLLFGA